VVETDRRPRLGWPRVQNESRATARGRLRQLSMPPAHLTAPLTGNVHTSHLISSGRQGKPPPGLSSPFSLFRQGNKTA
jgi:hypothetical protein